jgi:hypothetical protein
VKPEDYPKFGRPLKPLDNVIIMPDLRNHSNGAFRLCDRFLGLDRDHYKLVIESQAQLHAVSWAYKSKRGIGSLYDEFPFLNNDLGKIMEPFLEVTEANINMNEEVFQDNPEILQGLAHLRSVYKSVAGFFWGCDLGQNERGHTKDNVLKKPGKTVENEVPWSVLLHGDCWSNNMMFRYDEKTGRPVEVVFIDLQFCQVSDPMFDICYTLFASAQPDLRRKHLQSMLHVYFDTFTATCQKLRVPPLPGWGWEEFNRRFRRATIAGGYMALQMHIMLKNVDDCENLDEAMTKVEASGDNGGKKDANENMSEIFKVMSKHTNLHPAFKPRITAVFEDLVNDGVI